MVRPSDRCIAPIKAEARKVPDGIAAGFYSPTLSERLQPRTWEACVRACRWGPQRAPYNVVVVQLEDIHGFQALFAELAGTSLHYIDAAGKLAGDFRWRG